VLKQGEAAVSLEAAASSQVLDEAVHNAAAIKIQALQRGRIVRKQLKSAKISKDDPEVIRNAAATKIQVFKTIDFFFPYLIIVNNWMQLNVRRFKEDE
jgi:hypothetical protein